MEKKNLFFTKHKSTKKAFAVILQPLNLQPLDQKKGVRKTKEERSLRTDFVEKRASAKQHFGRK